MLSRPEWGIALGWLNMPISETIVASAVAVKSKRTKGKWTGVGIGEKILITPCSH
jgi:hypothetical protein